MTRPPTQKTPAKNPIQAVREHHLFKLAGDISVLHWICTTPVSLVVAILEAIMHKSLPLSLAWFFVLYGVSAFAFKIFVEWKKDTKTSRWALTIPLGALAIIVVVWTIVRVPVYGPFSRIWQDEFDAKLGQPTKKYRFVANNVAHQSEFEHATHIWINEGYFYVFNDDGTYEEVEEKSPSNPDDWQNDKYVQGRLGLDKSCRPPVGSMAYAYYLNPSHFSRMGCRVWKCDGESPIVVQDFDMGRMIGIFRDRPDPNWDNGEIFILYPKTKTWEKRRAHHLAPTAQCSP